MCPPGTFSYDTGTGSLSLALKVPVAKRSVSIRLVVRVWLAVRVRVWLAVSVRLAVRVRVEATAEPGLHLA